MSTVKSPQQIQKRIAIAEFMDNHPSKFTKPTSYADWVELAESGDDPEGKDRATVDKALGMLSNLFRSAQSLLAGMGPVSLADMVAADDSGLIKNIAVDPGAYKFAASPGNDVDQDDVEEREALGKSITIYKMMEAEGVVPKGSLLEVMQTALDKLPGDSDIMIDLKHLAKEISMIEASAFALDEA